MSESKKKDQSQANALYSAATTALRERHKDEFQTILENLYAEAGLTYRRRKTAEEREAEERAKALAKAQEQVTALVEKFGSEVLDVLPGGPDEMPASVGF